MRLLRPIAIASLLLFAGVTPDAAKAAPLDVYFTTSDHVQLHYLAFGQASRPTVILVPGWLMPGDIFNYVATELSNQYLVIAFDPRSHGRSDRPGFGHTPSRMAGDLRELMTDLKVSQAVMIGWSLGCAEISAYIARYGGDSVLGYGCIDGFLTLPPEVPAAQNEFAFYYGLEENYRATVSAEIRDSFTRLPPALFDHLLESAMKTPADTAEALNTNFLKVDGLGALATFGRPIIFYAAGTKNDQASALGARIPAARIEYFPHARHALFSDDPDHFVAITRSFMARATTAAPPTAPAPGASPAATGARR
ncbi:MAG TPA: alpha/beta hydrolase [Candidatus Baltobacteraceae bacterium]|nr:alpha/beta hydrolase [Candidatus Baltobacteraceae bacterium]